jgi:hypothetical protein
MSQYNSEFKKCPHPVGAFSGITLNGKRVIASPLSCNSWACPYCGPKLKKALFRRVLGGVMGNEKLPRFGRKFLTLTYGGHAKRLDSDPLSAYEEMSIAWHNTVKALRHKYGNFHYFKICELHKDGWPHFHVMLVGETIVPKQILEHIRHYWCEQNGMGFIRINAIDFKDGKHATNYMLKYITKNIQKVGKGKRIFTASVGALLKRIKQDWAEMMVYLGPIDPTSEGLLIFDFGDRAFKEEGWAVPLINVFDRVKELKDVCLLVQDEAFRRVTSGSMNEHIR